MVRVAVLTVYLLAGATFAHGQARPQTLPPPPPGVPPQPVGRPSTTPPEPRPAAPTPTQPTPATSAPAPEPAAPAQTLRPTGVVAEPTPTEAVLGVPIHPSARFLRSYDAGLGQRYYLFGATSSYAELVAFYRNALRTRGDEVYDVPPVHMFEVGRFREQTMAFPPGVTIKDYASGGARGYLVPIPGAVPDRYPTIIQIVPVPLSER